MKPGDKVHLIKPTMNQPMVWVVPPGVHHISYWANRRWRSAGEDAGEEG